MNCDDKGAVCLVFQVWPIWYSLLLTM